MLLAGTGLRPGEALGLTVDGVEFLRRTVRVDRQLVTMPNEPVQLGPVKTPSSVRTYAGARIPARRSGRPRRALFPRCRRAIFTDGKGDPIRRSAPGHLWRRAAAAAGIDGFTPHDRRHDAAPVLIDQAPR